MFFNTCGGEHVLPQAPSPAPAPHELDLRFDCPNLQQGSTGACVTLLQRLLNGHGASLTIDGIFGPATDAAVRRFQSQNGLSADGIVGPLTKSALYGSPTRALDLRTACGLLLRGSSGSFVTQLQKLLNSKGASLVVDGTFGSATDSAVRSFQSSHGLVVDRIVGPKTKAALYGSSSGLDLRSDCGLLQQGSTGACVKLLQQMLNAHGANLAVDGIFGPATDSAVRGTSRALRPQAARASSAARPHVDQPTGRGGDAGQVIRLARCLTGVDKFRERRPAAGSAAITTWNTKSWLTRTLSSTAASGSPRRGRRPPEHQLEEFHQPVERLAVGQEDRRPEQDQDGRRDAERNQRAAVARGAASGWRARTIESTFFVAVTTWTAEAAVRQRRPRSRAPHLG